MSMVLLQVNFDLDPARNEDLQATLERAYAVAQVPGLLWKVWLRDPERGRGGGIYLFRDSESAHAWGDGRFETMAERMPWTRNITVEYFGVQEDFSRVTRAIPATPVAKKSGSRRRTPRSGADAAISAATRTSTGSAA